MDHLLTNIVNEEYINEASSQEIPVLTIPKSSTSFDASGESSDEIVINLNITTTDVEGNALNLYKGLCNVKFVDDAESSGLVPGDDYAIVTENIGDEEVFTDSKWINVDENNISIYPGFDFDSQPSSRGPVTVEHHNTYITQNIINYGSEPLLPYTADQQPDAEFDARSMHIGGEFEYEDFMSGMREVIVNENVFGDDEETTDAIDNDSRDNALKQLLTTNLIGSHRQSKTIVFSGQDSLQGHTIQKISFNDPDMKCKKKRAKQIHIADLPNPQQKKYQCDHCKDIFMDIASFKDHIIAHQNKSEPSTKIPVNYICTVCSRVLKSQKKIKIHAQGHGDPNLECSRCSQVFASKFTLKKHYESHKKETPCSVCKKTFTSPDKMKSHLTKMHSNHICEICNFVANNLDQLAQHLKDHELNGNDNNVSQIDLDPQDSIEVDLITFGDVQELETSSTGDTSLVDEEEVNSSITDDASCITDKSKEKNEANSVIQKVMSSKVFLKQCKSARLLKETKTCDVCMKSFDRMSDLKRHLIEHFIKCTMATTPINEDGSYDILCGICKREFFTDFNSYKDHLRKHAKLTIYRCTICNKSFSDSSNFSKHKKIHGVSYYQCDLCSRRFHSKKMIAQHMEYHIKHEPLKCKYCGKIFHFQSNLNKHVRAAHNRITNKFRCRYCDQFLKSVKEKWDHEWNVHNVRKILADCDICDAKFRKYSELKRHCKKYHSFEILVVDGEVSNPLDLDLP